MARFEKRIPAGPLALGNPLCGLVPYAAPTPGRFPHAMEFSYFPLSDLMTGPDTFRWDPLERFLEEVRGRGNQGVFRVWMQYPGRPGGIPEFLIRDGLKVHRWLNTNTAPFPPAEVATPDYSDNRLRTALVRFIEALGKRFDGDPRVAYVTAGLLGTWGEWHDYPRTDLWASKLVQEEVMDAYRAALRKTPVLLRTPAGAGDPHYAPTAGRGFGYHDDSFCWATLDTGNPADSWFFETRLKAAGEHTIWRQHPIGGEIRPEAWGIVFDDIPGPKQMQPFDRCVALTHASWLMDTGLFREKASPVRLSRATESVRRMGFAPRIERVVVQTSDRAAGRMDLRVVVRWSNVGNAPHYHGWQLAARVVGNDGTNRAVVAERAGLSGVLPGGTKEPVFSTVLPRSSAPFAVELQIPNPVRGGKSIAFANTAPMAADGTMRIGF